MLSVFDWMQNVMNEGHVWVTEWKNEWMNELSTVFYVMNVMSEWLYEWLCDWDLFQYFQLFWLINQINCLIV